MKRIPCEMPRRRNPVREQSRVGEAVELFRKYGYTMFPQQRKIYSYLSSEIRDKSVLEAGCGDGQGTYDLFKDAMYIVGTDSLQENVNYAQEMYQDINFEVWNIEKRFPRRADIVVCIETLEHVEDPERAIANLMAAARETVWISTPNGIGKPHPPENPYHVQEYTPQEIFNMVPVKYDVRVIGWDDWELQTLDTLVDPLVYRVSL